MKFTMPNDNEQQDVPLFISISCDSVDRRTLQASSSDEYEVKLVPSKGSQDARDQDCSVPSDRDTPRIIECHLERADKIVEEARRVQCPVERTDKIIEEARKAVGVSIPKDQISQKIIEEAKKDLAKRKSRNRHQPYNDTVEKSSADSSSPSKVIVDRSACASPTMSDSAESWLSPATNESGFSMEDYEKAIARLSSKYDIPMSPSNNGDKMLKKIDGVEKTRIAEKSYNPFAILDYIWGNGEESTKEDEESGRSISFAAKSNRSSAEHRLSPLSHNIRQKPASFSERISAAYVDMRMPGWVSERTKADGSNPGTDRHEDYWDNSYYLGTSRTIVVHEVVRGSWTWCNSWSPNGRLLALGTENHHLAVADTDSSTVWKVRHDKRIKTPGRNDSTNTIRSIAWGSQFIATGGTGNCVTILAPTEPYPILHTIKNTGFVGTLDWRLNSTVLAIGSRDDKCTVVDIVAAEGDASSPLNRARHIKSNLLVDIGRPDWVNVVAFSPGGTILAIGDRTGAVVLYDYVPVRGGTPTITHLTSFVMDGAILSLEWSPDGKWLYAGGEDFTVTVIATLTWNIVHQLKRDRWVQFIASSQMGTHVAVGGLSSEVTILDTQAHWKPVMNIELKGLVPLSARWHPEDQYLVLTGQNDTVIAVETTNARHVEGFYLYCMSPIQKVVFSPDNNFAAVGNEAGVVTFYNLAGSTFVTAYEMVLTGNSSQSIEWSPEGGCVLIGSGKTLTIVGKTRNNDRKNAPPSSSGFSVCKVIRNEQDIHSISIHPESKYVAVGCSETTLILDAIDFSHITEMETGAVTNASWSRDGTWYASITNSTEVKVYETSDDDLSQWLNLFTFHTEETCLALTWSPVELDGLKYLAYGGANKKVTVVEIRVHERTWETVFEVDRPDVIYDLDWNSNGMLAVAIGDGTVTLVDLGYLQSGSAVNEMNYNWQRQGVTSFTEIRRSKGENSMRTVRWMSPRQDRNSFLAVGGIDGALEVLDLTERELCRGFSSDE